MNHHMKTALVTGGSRGIGRSIALKLAQDGFQVIITFSHHAELADSVVQDIIQAGGIASAIQVNIADEKQVAFLFETLKSSGKTLNVVVHNAGIMQLSKITVDSLNIFDQMIQTNLRGAYLVLAHAAACIEDGGRILAVSSSVIDKAFPLYGPYIASKIGVEGLIPVLANELRGRHINVNAIAPGPTATELFFKDKTEEQIHAISKLSPLERIGSPEEIADVVSMLCSESGSWINAQVIKVNGGF